MDFTDTIEHIEHLLDEQFKTGQFSLESLWLSWSLTALRIKTWFGETYEYFVYVGKADEAKARFLAS